MWIDKAKIYLESGKGGDGALLDMKNASNSVVQMVEMAEEVEASTSSLKKE